MDQELIAYLDKRFEQIDKQFEEVNERMSGLEAAIRGNEAAIRGNGVEIEGLRVDVKQVAEGVAGCNQRIDAFQTDVAKQFDEMRQMFDTSHSNLHRRVSLLEARRAQRPAR